MSLLEKNQIKEVRNTLLNSTNQDIKSLGFLTDEQIEKVFLKSVDNLYGGIDIIYSHLLMTINTFIQKNGLTSEMKEIVLYRLMQKIEMQLQEETKE